MEFDFSAADVNELKMKCGQTLRMESLKKAVVPPFLLVIPFIELPDFVKLISKDNLEGEGVQGCIFSISALQPGKGNINTGFKDLRSGKHILEKVIFLEVIK